MPHRLLRASLVLLSAIAAGCATASRSPASGTYRDLNKNGRLDPYEDASLPIERRVDDLLSRMTVEEKTCQLATLYGYGRVLADPAPTPAWKTKVWKDGIANIDEMHNGIGKFNTPEKNPALASPQATAEALNKVQKFFVEETRLGIPAEFTNEGVRGVNYHRSTNFPADIALGATWDRDLVHAVGGVVAREGKAVGYRNIYAPIMDLSRDPRWGRVVETYGEDPYLVAELGIQMATAIQAEGITSTAKHFAVYSEPKGGRDGNARVDPHVSPREMEMLHLRPWERLVKEAHIRGAMSSYNDYDGLPISGAHEFLVDRLRTRWGFDGYVVSDSAAVENLYNKHHVAANDDDAAAMYVREGGNVRTAFNGPENFVMRLRREIAAGKLPMSVVDARVRDVLRVKFEEGLFDHPYVDAAKANAAIHTDASAALALRAARESLVLLKNDSHALPLSKSLRHVLVCGPTADMTETSLDRYGSTGGHVTTVLEGIKTLLARSGAEVTYAKGCNATDKRWPESELFPEPPAGDEAQQISDAVAAAKNSDVVILCLGDSNATIGESKSRSSLDLPGYQLDLAKALVATGKPVVCVLLTGRPATINWVNRYVPAIVLGWFPGEAGGTAIAEALFGDYNPGGKLPVTFPKTVGQVPFNFPYKPASHAPQSKFVDPNGFGNSTAEGPLYPFAFGLSYTTFEYSNLMLSKEKVSPTDQLTLTFTLKNTGRVAGDEIPQLYVTQDASSVITYTRALHNFRRVHLAPGEQRTVTFNLNIPDLYLIDRQNQRVVEPGTFTVRIATDSESSDLESTFEVVR